MLITTKKRLQREIKFTPVFEANKQAYLSGVRHISNQGSSRSSKTFSVMQLFAVLAQKEPGTSISIVSPSLPHLKRGAMRDFFTILGDGPNGNDGMGIYNEKRHNKTDNIYHFGNGSYVEFFGTENEGKVRGPGRRILFMNEANLIKKAVSHQLVMRTTKTVFYDYNPADLYNWVYDVRHRDNSAFIHSTYQNNRGNLSIEQINDIEYLKQADKNLWRVFGLGLPGTSAETIYTHWMLCPEFPPDCDEVYYGVDFGFNNPNVVVKVGVKDNRVYVDELFYESGFTTTELGYYMASQLGMTKRTGVVFCDSGRPDSIVDLQKAGINAREAKKDVYDGILSVKSRPLYITQRSTNIIKEIKSYKWMKDPKTDIVLDQPVKFNDHAMDAIRYAIFSTYQRFKRKTAAA